MPGSGHEGSRPLLSRMRARLGPRTTKAATPTTRQPRPRTRISSRSHRSPEERQQSVADLLAVLGIPFELRRKEPLLADDPRRQESRDRDAEDQAPQRTEQQGRAD